MFKTANILALAFSTCALSACYMEKPLDTVPPPPNTRITAQLTDSGTYVMGNAIGQGVLAVEGVVESADHDVWKIHMLHADQKDGRTVDWNNELVSFPSNVLVSPTVRVLDKKKSWIVAGATVLGVVIVGRSWNNIFANDEKPTGDIPQATILIRVGGR